MKVLVKTGVIIGEINARLFHTCITVSSVFGEYGIPAVLTSGKEGTHIKGSLHYENLAWDFRLRTFPTAVRKEVADKVRGLLNIKNHDYDVLIRSAMVKDEKGKMVKLEWLHIEYQPKIKREV